MNGSAALFAVYHLDSQLQRVIIHPVKSTLQMTRICRNLLIVATCLASGWSAFATTIIVVYTPEGAIIAADSKVASLDGKESRLGCKIHIKDNYVWASSGFSFDTHGLFNVAVLVPQAMGTGVPFRSSADTLETQLKSFFNGYLVEAKDAGLDLDNQQIDVLLVNEKTPGQISTLTVNNKGFERKDCPSEKCPASGVVVLGERSEIEKTLSKRPQIWSEMGSVPAALNFLIEQEKFAVPGHVGGDTIILLVDSKGVRWIQEGHQEGECRSERQ